MGRNPKLYLSTHGKFGEYILFYLFWKCLEQQIFASFLTSFLKLRFGLLVRVQIKGMHHKFDIQLHKNAVSKPVPLPLHSKTIRTITTLLRSLKLGPFIKVQPLIVLQCAFLKCNWICHTWPTNMSST